MKKFFLILFTIPLFGFLIYGSNIPVSKSHWNYGSGIGSKSHWNYGSGIGSKSHWNYGSGIGSKSHWNYGSGYGSKSHWNYGSGQGSKSHWNYGSGITFNENSLIDLYIGLNVSEEGIPEGFNDFMKIVLVEYPYVYEIIKLL